MTSGLRVLHARLCLVAFVLGSRSVVFARALAGELADLARESGEAQLADVIERPISGAVALSPDERRLLLRQLGHARVRGRDVSAFAALERELMHELPSV